jgi:hypothetical protein
VDGSIGPTLSACVEHDVPTGDTCQSIDGSVGADLNAHADAFGFHWSFNLFHLTFWTHHFANDCTDGSGPGGSGAGSPAGGSNGGPGSSEVLAAAVDRAVQAPGADRLSLRQQEE